jgi:hypothetical protein
VCDWMDRAHFDGCFQERWRNFHCMARFRKYYPISASCCNSDLIIDPFSGK